MSETFSCGRPVFLALVDTCNCVNHFVWPLQLHRTLLSSSSVLWGLAEQQMKCGWREQAGKAPSTAEPPQARRASNSIDATLLGANKQTALSPWLAPGFSSKVFSLKCPVCVLFRLQFPSEPRQFQEETRSPWHSLQIRGIEVSHIIVVFLWQWCCSNSLWASLVLCTLVRAQGTKHDAGKSTALSSAITFSFFFFPFNWNTER